MKSYLILLHLLASLPSSASDPCLPSSPSPRGYGVTFPRPFTIQEPTAEHYKVAQRCSMDSEIFKKKDKLYLRVTVYYRNIKIMKNVYELDMERIAKL